MSYEVKKTEYTYNVFDVSVIIVNWNSGKYLKDTIESLYSYNKDLNYEVIIIDNNSDINEESF